MFHFIFPELWFHIIWRAEEAHLCVGSPLLFQSVLQHLDSPHQILLHVLLTFPLTLQKRHLRLRQTDTEGKRERDKYGTDSNEIHLRENERLYAEAPQPYHHQ